MNVTDISVKNENLDKLDVGKYKKALINASITNVSFSM